MKQRWSARLRAGLMIRWTLLLYILVGAGVTGVMVGLTWADIGQLHSANYNSLEAMFRFRVEHGLPVKKAPIALITYSGTPSRAEHAQLVRKLTAAGARVIAFDVLFRLPKDPVNDNALIRAIRDSHRTVLQFRWTYGDNVSYAAEKTFDMPLKAIADAASGIGYANPPEADDDNTVRTATLFDGGLRGDQLMSWPAIVAKLYLGHLPGDLVAQNKFVVNYLDYPGYDFSPYGFRSFFSPPEPPASAFKDKIVIIGASAKESALQHDLVSTPLSFGPRFGVNYIANALNTIVTDSPIWPVDAPTQTLIVLLMGVLTTVVAVRFSIRGGALLGLVIVVAWVALVYYLFMTHRVWLNVTAPAVTAPAVYLAIMAVRYFTEEREKRRIRNIFSHYVSPQVVNKLVAQGQGLALAGERKLITVLFSDIRNFTTLSESLQPEQVVGFLNLYFEQMADIVFRYGGTLDKYVGDAVMALWNAPDDVEDGSLKACQAALEMQAAVDTLRPEFAKISPHNLEIGIGINTGHAVVGTLGAGRKKEYTAIGDTVNVASRLEGLNKQFGTGICISGEMAGYLPPDADLRPQGEVHVKGRAEPIQVLSLHALSGGAPRPAPVLPADLAAART